MTEHNEQLFQKNLKLWNNFNLQGPELIENLQCENVSFVNNSNGDLNLAIKKNSRLDYYYSRENIAIENNQQFEACGVHGTTVLYVYGLGLGYFYHSAKAWLHQNPSRMLIFLEDNLEILHRFFETDLATEVLLDKQVRIHYYNPELNPNPTLDVLTTVFMNEKYYYSVSNYNMSNNLERASKIQVEISFQASQKPFFFNELISMSHGQTYFNNYYINLKYLPQSYLADTLAGKFKGIPAIICGAGPSLKKNINVLKKLTDRAVIFAGGTAINALNSQGLQPHFAVAIDPNETHYSRTISNTAYQVPFMFRNRTNPFSVDLVQGDRLFVTGGYKFTEWLEGELDIHGQPQIDEGYNVVNLSTSIAHTMGFNPIIFVGVDLAYTDQKSYIDGLELHPIFNKGRTKTKGTYEELIKKKDIYGNPIDTLWKWASESSWYEVFVLTQKDALLINATEGGLGFPNVENMPLSAAAVLFMNNTYDFDAIIHGEIQNCQMPAKVTYDNILMLLDKFKISLLKCAKYFDDLEKKYCGYLGQLLSDPGLDLKIPDHEKEFEPIKDELAFKYCLEFNYKVYQRRHDLRRKYLNPSGIEKVDINELKHNLNLFQFFVQGSLQNLKFLQEGEKNIATQQYRMLGTEKFESKEIPESTVVASDQNYGILERSFYPGGEVKWERYYLDNLLNGPSKFYDPSGKVLGSGFYNKGLKEGEAHYYYSSGALHAIRRYSKGAPNGKQEYYYPNGTLKSILNYTNGLLNGDVLLYFPHGKIKREIHFKDGLIHGIEKMWDYSGNLALEACHEMGKPAGINKAWYPSGILAKQVTFVEGSEPLIEYWAQEGTPIPKHLFDNEDYFDYMLNETEKFNLSLIEIYDQIETLLHDAHNLKENVRLEIIQALDLIKLEISRLTDINSKIKEDFGPKKNEEAIWKTPRLQQELQNKLHKFISKMREDIGNIKTAFEQIKQLINK